MKVVCDACGQKYSIQESKIKTKTSRFRCKKCDNIIAVTKPVLANIEDIEESGVYSSFKYAKESEGYQEERLSKEKSKKEISSHFGKVKFFNSMQIRVSIILIILTTTILFGYVAFNYFTTKKRMNQELMEAAESSATRLAKNLWKPVWALDEKQVNEIVSSEMKAKQLFAIIVRDAFDKSIISGNMRDANWGVVNIKSDIRGEYIINSKDLIKDEEKIGIVEVYFTTMFMRRAFYQGVIDIAITSVILNIAILFVIFFTLRKIIILPIMKLTNATEQMSLGDLGVEIDIHSKNEIGILADSISRLQVSIKYAMGRLSRK